jgi:cell wall-associated NlpC family hydrolase
MAEGQSNQYALQIVLDLKESMAQLEQGYALLTKFNTTVESNVVINMSTEDAEKRLAALRAQVTQVQAEVAALTAQSVAMTEALAASGAKLEAILPGASATIAKGAAASTVELDHLKAAVDSLGAKAQQEAATEVAAIERVSKARRDAAAEAERLAATAKRIVTEAQALRVTDNVATTKAAQGQVAAVKATTAAIAVANTQAAKGRDARGRFLKAAPIEPVAPKLSQKEVNAAILAARAEVHARGPGAAQAIAEARGEGAQFAAIKRIVPALRGQPGVAPLYREANEAYNSLQQTLLLDAKRLRAAGDYKGSEEAALMRRSITAHGAAIQAGRQRFSRAKVADDFDSGPKGASDAQVRRRGVQESVAGIDDARITLQSHLEKVGGAKRRADWEANMNRRRKAHDDATQKLEDEKARDEIAAYKEDENITTRGHLERVGGESRRAKFDKVQANLERQKSLDETAAYKQDADMAKAAKKLGDRQRKTLLDRAAYDKRTQPKQREEAAYAEGQTKVRGGDGPPKKPNDISLGIGSLVKASAAYAAYGAAREAVAEFVKLQQIIADIQGTLKSKNPFEAATLGEGISKAAVKYGLSLTETAAAAREFAHAGLDAKDVITELDHTLGAVKGLGITMEQARELQLAIHAVTEESDRFTKGIDYTGAVLDKVSVVESRYAVGAEDLATALKILTPLMENFTTGMAGLNDVFDYTNAITTVMVDKLRITGQQAANVTKILLSRIVKPDILKKLQGDFGLEIKNKDTDDFLPIDQLINKLGQKFATLGKIQQKQFAQELSGGRNIHAVVALLQDYAKVGEIATVSANSFGDAQTRAGIASDTLLTRLGRLKTQFALFVGAAGNATGIGAGVNALVTGMSNLLSVGSQSGPAGSILSLVGSGVLAIGLRAIYMWLGRVAIAATAAGAAATGFQSSVLMFTPGGLVLAGLGLLVAGWGLYTNAVKSATEETERYQVKVRKIEDLTKTPAYATFKGTAEDLGLTPKDASLGQVQAGYKAVIGIVQGKSFAPLQKDIAEFSKTSDDEMAKMFEKTPKRFEDFQRAVTKAFLEVAPNAVKESIGKMATETERINAVMTLVTSATAGAVYQMKAAIEDMHNASVRMMDDTMRKMDELQDKKKNANIWERYEKAVGLTPANIFDAVPKLGLSGIRTQVARAADDLAKYKPIFHDEAPGGLNEFANKIVFNQGLKERANAGQAGTIDSQLRVLMNRILADPVMSARYVVQSMMANGDYKSLALQSKSFLTANGADQETLNRIKDLKQNEEIVKRRDELVKAGMPPELIALDAATRALARGATAVTPGKVDVKVKGLNEAMVAFKDVLLDTAKDIYEAFKSYNREKEFAKTFGQSYDEGGARLQLAKSMQGKFSDIGDTYGFDLAGIANKAEHIKAISKKDKDGNLIARDQTVRTEYEEQIKELRDQYETIKNRDLSGAFGKSDEGKVMASKFKEATSAIGFKGDFTKFEDFMTEFGLSGVRLNNQAKDRIELADQEIVLQERKNQLAEAELSITASLGDKLSQHAASAAATYTKQAARIQALKENDPYNAAQYTRDLNSLNVAYQMNALYDARLAKTEAQRALDQQIYANIQSMFSGVKKLLTDSSIWEAVVSPTAATRSQRWKQSAEAIRKILFDTITPIFSTISDRILDNTFKHITDSLFEKVSKLTGIAGSPESELKQNLDDASANFNAVGANVAITIAAAFEAAGDRVVAKLAAAGVGGLPGAGTTPSTEPGMAPPEVAKFAKSLPTLKIPGISTAQSKTVTGIIAAGVAKLGARKQDSDLAQANKVLEQLAAERAVTMGNQVTLPPSQMPGIRMTGSKATPMAMTATVAKLVADKLSVPSMPGVAGGTATTPEAIAASAAALVAQNLAVPPMPGLATTGTSAPEAVAATAAALVAQQMDLPVGDIPGLSTTPGKETTATMSVKVAGLIAGHASAKKKAAAKLPPQEANAYNLFKAGDKLLGTPFEMGSTNAKKALDCSAFIGNIFAQLGLPLPRTTGELAHAGKLVSKMTDLKAGDIILFDTEHSDGKGGWAAGPDGVPDHSAIYAGNNKILHESGSGGMVRYDDLSTGYGKKAMSYAMMGRRILPEGAAGTDQAFFKATGYKQRTTAKEIDPWIGDKLGSYKMGYPVDKLGQFFNQNVGGGPLPAKTFGTPEKLFSGRSPYSNVGDATGLSSEAAVLPLGLQLTPSGTPTGSIWDNIPPPQVAKTSQGTKFNTYVNAHAEEIQAGALLIGKIGGTLIGKGGQYAQQGSTIGATGGMIVGSLVGGPVGGAIGSTLGGLIGGYLGGRKDAHAHDNDPPIIKSLDAIERAQRDTITTIMAQTDALLKPENRFMNLPSTFSVPSYAPAFGPGAGGGDTNHVAINVTVNGGNPNEVQAAVEKAVGNVLSNQRRSTGWNQTF